MHNYKMKFTVFYTCNLSFSLGIGNAPSFLWDYLPTTAFAAVLRQKACFKSNFLAEMISIQLSVWTLIYIVLELATVV